MTLYKGNKVIAGSRSYIGNIGDIKYTARTDLPYGGAWCNGGIKLKDEYPTVYQMLLDGKLQYVDISTYENVLSLNGSCGFFGLDTATESFRLPSLNDVYIKSGQVADEFGAESLPNITGEINVGDSSGPSSSASGAFEVVNGGVQATGWDQDEQRAVFTFDASLSSSTYKDGAKVNPDHVKYRAYVVLYNGDDIKSDITKEYQLNNPFFFGMSQYFEVDPKNASWLKSDGAFHSGAVYESFYNWLLSILNGETVEGVSVKSSTDAYGDYDYVVNTTEETFRLPVKVKLASGNAVVGNGTSFHFANGADYKGVNEAGNWVPRNNDISQNQAIFLGLSNVTGGTALGLTTDPEYSGIETSSNGLKLYFYVGDVVSDANLLNAGKVLDLLAKLESYDYVIESKVATAEDPSWYRVYKSGWVEQGGNNFGQSVSNRVSVTFPKVFANNNYSLTLGDMGDHQGTGFWTFGVVSKTVTGFTHQGGSNGNSTLNSFHWEAKGQGAQKEII